MSTDHCPDYAGTKSAPPLSGARLTAAGIRALDDLLHMGLPDRPVPVVGRSTAPALCPSSTDDRELTGVPLAGGGERPAGRCVEQRCGHWLHGCTLGSSVAKVGLRMVDLGSAVGQPCGIAAQCRWLAENGTTACVLCPALVREDIRELSEKAEVSDG